MVIPTLPEILSCLLVTFDGALQVEFSLPPLILEPEQVDRVMEKLDGALASARRLRPVAKIKNQIDHLLGKQEK